MDGIEWLFFDIGYTLVDEDSAHKARILATVTRNNRAGGNLTFRDLYDAMVAASRQFRPPYRTATDRLGISLLQAYPKELEVPYSDAKCVLCELKKKYNIGVIANQSAGTGERLRRYGLLPWIDLCFSSAEEGIAKPDPRLFHRALDKARAEPAHCVMIGDRLDNDIQPARKLGMRTIWIRQGFGGEQEIISEEYRPDEIVNNLRELLLIL